MAGVSALVYGLAAWLRSHAALHGDEPQYLILAPALVKYGSLDPARSIVEPDRPPPGHERDDGPRRRCRRCVLDPLDDALRIGAAVEKHELPCRRGRVGRTAAAGEAYRRVRVRPDRRRVDAALEVDVPEGGTMLGFGAKFAGEGSPVAGQNMRAAPVVVQYVDDKAYVVWPKSQAQRDAVLPFPAGTVYSAK